MGGAGVFVDGKVGGCDCPSSRDGVHCPECGVIMDSGYGFASGCGIGSYSYCLDHGLFDFVEDKETVMGSGKKFMVLPERQRKIKEIRAMALENGFVVGFERDTSEPMESCGAFVAETHLGRSNLIKALEVVNRSGGQYGRATIYKLVKVGELDEICEAVNGG